MKRLLSWLLALVMIISCLPMSAIPAFATEEAPEIESGTTDPNFGVDFSGELVPIDLTTDLRADMTATVSVPAGKTYSYTAYGIANGMEMTINDETTVCNVAPGAAYTWDITNDGAESAEYVITIGFPVGHMENPEVIEELSYSSFTVNQTAGDSDGYFYIYTAPSDGTITLYFTDVPSVTTTETTTDEEGNETTTETTTKYTCDIAITNNTTGAQKTLLADGVDNYGLELTVDVSAGDEIIINVIGIEDTEGNYYPEAAMTWCGNFTYPVGSEQNPAQINVTLDSTGAAEVTVTVPAGEHSYYVIYGANGTTMSVNGEGATEITMFNNAVDFDNTAGTEEATYVLSFTTPVGAYMNPEVIEDMNDYSDTNTTVEGTPYYYTWTATEDGTVTLDITDGANIVVNNLNTNEQFVLAESIYDENWNFGGWNVQENLQIEVTAGDVLKIEVAGYSSENAWDVPSVTYTLTGDFEGAVTVPTVTFTTSLAAWLEIEDVIKFGVSAKISNPENYDLTDEEFVGRFKLLMWDADADAPASAEEATIDANYDYIIDAKYNEENARFEFLIDVPAKNMGDKYVWVPCYENGDGTYTYGRFYNKNGEFYAPSTYCYTQIDKSSTSQLDLDLFYAILNYCAAAQVYFANNGSGYTYDTLINADLPADKQVLNFDESAVRTSYSVDSAKEGDLARDKSVVTSRGGFLALESTIDATWYSNVNITTTSQKIYYWTEEVYLASDVLSLEDAFLCEDLTAANGRYEGAVEGRAAKQMFDLVYACMVYTDADGNQYSSGVLAFSPERYIYLNMNNTSSVGMAEMCRWMFVYGKAAQARFG